MRLALVLAVAAGCHVTARTELTRTTATRFEPHVDQARPQPPTILVAGGGFRFVEPLVWDDHVVGVRISLADATPKFVERLLNQAWARSEGKRLLEGVAIRTSGGHRRIVV